MKLIGAVGIKVRPVARDFKRELNSQINDLPEKSVKVKVDADTRAAEKAIKNTKDKAERENITLPVGVDYDGLRNAQQQIRQALKKVADEPFTLKMDTKSLNDGLKDIKKRLGEAEVSMHVAQDEAGFRSVLAKIEQIRRAKTEIPVKFTADTKDLKRQERETRKELEQAVINKGIKLNYVPDREGLAGAIKTIDDALRNLKRVQINPKLNKEELQRERDRLQAQLDAKPAVLKINKDVDGYTAALEKIRALQREAAQVQFRYKTDKEGLKKAEKQLEEWRKREVEKAGIKITYANDRTGLEGAIKELDEALAKFKKITINPKLNEEALAAEKAKLEKQLAEIPLEIKYHDDREGIKQAIAELEKLQRAAEISFRYTNDPEGLAEAINMLQWELDSKPATLSLVPDKEGYEAALKQVEELQRLAKSIEFEYGTDEQGLKDAADKLRENIAALTVSPTMDFKYKDDSNGIKGALAEVEKELEKLGLITITANLDEEGLLAAKAELESKLTDSTWEIKVNSKDLDALKKEQDKLNDLLRLNEGEDVSLVVGMDEHSMRAAKQEIADLIHEAERNPVNLDVEPVGLALAAAQIGWASRSRVVPFFIRIDNKSRAIAEGVLKSLSGYNTVSSIGKTLERVMTNFDTVIAKGALVTGVIANIVNTLGFALTNVLSIGEGMAEVVGLAAMAPAALSAAAAIVLVNVAAFRDFKSAIDGTKGALEKLPPNAQAAALALRGTWEAIQQPIQNAYWEAMGTSLQDMVSTLLPQVRDGLATAGTHIGQFAKNTADTMQKLGDNDGMKAMFTNLGDMFKNATGIAEPLTMAINTLGLRGSEYLPEFGQWLTDITVQFNDWIQKADQAGDINTWIENGVQSLKDMWSAGDGVLDVIRGISGAAMAAGGQTLGGFADEMQRWGEIANGEPFQSRLTQIFRGARQGASNLNEGFMELAQSAGGASSWIAKMLTSLGDLGGLTLSNFSQLFRSDNFKGGVFAAVLGLNDMMRDLRPSFSSVASVIGTLGTTAAATFRGLAPLINIVTGALEDVMDIIGDELPGMAKALTGQFSNTFATVGVVIKAVAQVVEPLLKAFLAMPEAIQTIILAAGGFMIMRGQISKMFTALNDKGAFRRFEGAWTQARTHLNNEGTRMQTATRMVTTATGNMVVGTAAGLNSMSQSWSRYTAAVGSASGLMRTVGTAVTMPIQAGANMAKSALGGLVGFLGGPVGAALAVGAIGISLYGQAQAKAKQKIDNLAQSLDQQTGAITQSTKKLVATDWMEQGTGRWENFFRGVIQGAKAAHETVAILGDTTAEVTDLIASGGKDYDKYIDNLKLIEENLDKAKLADTQGGISHTTMSLNDLSEATGYSVEALKQLDGADVGNLRTETEAANAALVLAREKVLGVARALNIGEGSAAKLSGAMTILKDEASTAADRVDATKLALDRLKGGALSQQDAQRNFAKAWESSMSQIEDATTNAETGAKESLNHLIDDVDGHIIDLSGKGGELYDATKGFTDSLIDRSSAAAQHVLDNKGTMAEAGAAAASALQLSKEEIQEFADKVGIDVGKAELMLRGFMGQEWETKAILDGNAELFFEEKAKAEAAGEEFGQKQWEAVLWAKNLAKLGIDEAKGDGTEWGQNEYGAVLKAYPEEALRTLNQTLGITDDKWSRGDFSSILTALDGTGPGVAMALLAMSMVTDGDYTAEIQALLDAYSKEKTEKDLDDTTNADRSAYIKAVPETENARLALDGVAQDRDANFTGVPHPDNAILVLDSAALPRNAWFIGIPDTLNAEGQLNNTGRTREPWYYGKTSLDDALWALNNAAGNRTPWYLAAVEERSKNETLATLAGIASEERTAVIKTRVEPIPAANGHIFTSEGSIAFANGGMLTRNVHSYAGGGTENHTAQIARGGWPVRVWAEPETGGEAYIPLSASKRARSTQILEQVATQFGMKLTSNDVVQFNNGGIVDGGRTGGGVNVNIGSYVSSHTDTPDDIARALMRRIKVQGANSPLEAF